VKNMDEQAMAREKFEKDFDNAVFRSTPKGVFEFLREQEKKRLITLYAGTYSFESSVLMHKGCEKATFYFYLNGYNYGYSLRYFQGRFKLERDERIFFKDHKKAYSKKLLSNHKTDRKDMRSGEYFANRKSIIKCEISEGLLEIVLSLVFFAIGFGVLSLFNLTDIDGDLAMLIGGVVIILPILIMLGIIAIFKKCKKGKSKK
jgi:hypothetical protein